MLQVRGRHLGVGTLHSHTLQPKSSLSYPMGHCSGQYLPRSGQESSERGEGEGHVTVGKTVMSLHEAIRELWLTRSCLQGCSGLKLQQKHARCCTFWWDGPQQAWNPSGPPTPRKESGLTAEALAEQTPAVVLLEAVGAVVSRQGAVFQQRAEHGAHRFIRRL